MQLFFKFVERQIEPASKPTYIGNTQPVTALDFFARTPIMRHIFAKFALAAAAISLAGCGINSVPTAEENAKAKWADVESSYQRRADLIPNLVATVKAGAASEAQILTQVTDARSRATSINITTNDLSDPETFRKFEEGQNQLTQALGQLRTVVENYPQLQSQQGFRDLNIELAGSENRINTARGRYNEAVQQYNTTIRTFPDIIGAKIIHGAKPMTPFRAAAGSEKAPTVNF